MSCTSLYIEGLGEAECAAQAAIAEEAEHAFKESLLPDLVALQEFRSIATIFIATTIFCCNKLQYYHKYHVCGNSLHIWPQFSFVAIISYFVAIEGTYCSEMRCCCIMVVLLQRLRVVA
jgi:hypothetical protein